MCYYCMWYRRTAGFRYYSHVGAKQPQQAIKKKKKVRSEGTYLLTKKRTTQPAACSLLSAAAADGYKVGTYL